MKKIKFNRDKRIRIEELVIGNFIGPGYTHRGVIYSISGDEKELTVKTIQEFERNIFGITILKLEVQRDMAYLSKEHNIPIKYESVIGDIL